MCTMVTPRGMFACKRVPKGVLSTMVYFQGAMRDALDELIDNVHHIWGDPAGELVQRLEAVVTQLMERSLYTVAHKGILLRQGISW